MALEQTLDAVNNVNIKALAEMAAINALSHQNRLQLLAESSMGQILNKMNNLDPAEANSIATVTNAGLANKLSELSAAIANTQQLIKGAQTTPPPT